VSSNTVTTAYADAMLVATPAELLVDGMLVEGKKPLKLTGVSQEQMAKMERKMTKLQGQCKTVEQTYATASPVHTSYPSKTWQRHDIARRRGLV